jgi:hypothetical protein
MWSPSRQAVQSLLEKLLREIEPAASFLRIEPGLANAYEIQIGLRDEMGKPLVIPGAIFRRAFVGPASVAPIRRVLEAQVAVLHARHRLRGGESGENQWRRPSETRGPLWLVIVQEGYGGLYPILKARYGAHGIVIFDRRQAERRIEDSPVPVERRQGQRRKPLGLAEQNLWRDGHYRVLYRPGGWDRNDFV